MALTRTLCSVGRVRRTARRLAFGLLIVSGLVRPALAAPPAGPPHMVVILLPEALRPWIPKLEESAKHPQANGWPVAAFNPEPATKARPELDVEYRVGKTTADAKDASMVFHFTSPKAYMRGREPIIDVPFTAYDLPTAGGKPVELFKGVASRSGNDYEGAADNLAKGGLRSIGHILRLDYAARVFVEKPRLSPDQGGTLYAFAPATVDNTTNPPTARVKVRNQFPVPVILGLTLQGKIALVSGDQYFSYESPEIQPGETRELVVALKDLKPGQEPKWARLGSVLLIDPPSKPK